MPQHDGFLANPVRPHTLPRVRQLLAPAAVAIASNAPREPEQWDALLLRLTGKDVTRCPRGGVGPMRVIEELPVLTRPNDFSRRARRWTDTRREVTFAASAPEAATFEEVWPEVKGPQPYGSVLPRQGRDLITDVAAAFRAPSGTFFDFSAIHLLTTNTLDRLRELAPRSRFEVRRFRPNVVVEFSGLTGFVENNWSRRIALIGENVRLKVIIPTPRCVMTTLAQSDLPRDLGILRATADHNWIRAGRLGELPCAGVYAAVLTPGTVRRGDPVRLE